MKLEQEGARAVFDLDGATCLSCVYTIEHLGRKLEGVREVFVDVNAATVEVEYAPQSSRAVLEGIPEIVRRIGYHAALREPAARG